MATSDHPGSSGLPKLPTRRPRQDHGSGAVCARLLGGECAAQPDSLGSARDAILDTHGESSAPQAPGMGHPPYPCVPQFDRFACCPTAAVMLSELRRYVGELSS